MTQRNVILVIILLLIIAAAVVYIVMTQTDSTTNTDNANTAAVANEPLDNGEEALLNANTDGDVNAAMGNENINAAGPELTTEERAQAVVRDAKRLVDVRSMQAALESYKKANDDSYPAELISLVPAYLNGLPGNPAPGGITYTYTPIGSEPYAFYDLSYVLEVGAENIAPGDHTATPEGVAMP